MVSNQHTETRKRNAGSAYYSLLSQTNYKEIWKVDPGHVAKKRRWISGTLTSPCLSQDRKPPAQLPAETLVCHLCLSPVLCPCFISTFLTLVYWGPLGLFLPTLVFLRWLLYFGQQRAVCLPCLSCVEKAVQPCWSAGRTRHSGLVNQQVSLCVSKTPILTPHACSERLDSVTLRGARQLWLSWPTSSRLQLSKERLHPGWPVGC